MGNPKDDAVEDFGVVDHMRNKFNEEVLDMLTKDLEEETWDHKKNIERMKKAVKNDDGKTRMDLLPSKALEGIAKIFTFGAKKYNDYNYKNDKGLDWNRPFAACLRHLNAWNDGEDLDQESGKSHLYHAGCCIMMLIDLVDSNIGDDKRYESVDG